MLQVFGGDLVRQRNLALERTAHRRDAELHLDLVGVGRDLGHGLAAGNAARQHGGIVERFPQRLDRNRMVSAPPISSFMANAPYSPNSRAPDRH